MSTNLMPPEVRLAAGSVFHYTSAQGLLGLVQGGSAWASEASSLNDLAEIRQGWQTVQAVLERLPSSEDRDFLLQCATETKKSRNEVFVLSASSAGDDANQWRLYADGGRGYAVGLDASRRLAAYSKVAAPAPGEPPKAGEPIFGRSLRNVAEVTPWYHVLYEASQIERAVEELVLGVEAQQQAYVKQGLSKADLDTAGALLGEDASDALTTIAHLIKMPGFAGENEVRVVATFPVANDAIKYRATANGIVGYVELTASPTRYPVSIVRHPEPKALPLTSVRLGPLLSPEHKITVTGLLKQQGLDQVAVHDSEVPLR